MVTNINTLIKSTSSGTKCNVYKRYSVAKIFWMFSLANGPQCISARRLELLRPERFEVVVRGHDVEVDLLDIAGRTEPRHPPGKVNKNRQDNRQAGCSLFDVGFLRQKMSSHSLE